MSLRKILLAIVIFIYFGFTIGSYYIDEKIPFIAYFFINIFLAILVAIQSYYVHSVNQHNYARAVSRRGIENLESMKFSGVYIRERPAFNIPIIERFLPKHQSIEIRKKDGTRKHIGLGRVPSTREIAFINHDCEKYKTLNERESLIPVEMWYEFYSEFGAWISDIDVEIMEKLLLTPQESPKKYFMTDYFGFYFYPQKKETFISTCRSAIRNAFIKEYLIRTKQMSLDESFLDEKCTFSDFFMSFFTHKKKYFENDNKFSDLKSISISKIDDRCISYEKSMPNIHSPSQLTEPYLDNIYYGDPAIPEMMKHDGDNDEHDGDNDDFYKDEKYFE